MARFLEQKVNLVPDIFIQNHHPKEDESVIITCNNIWGVQIN